MNIVFFCLFFFFDRIRQLSTIDSIFYNKCRQFSWNSKKKKRLSTRFWFLRSNIFFQFSMTLLIFYHICCHLSIIFKNLNKKNAYWFWQIFDEFECNIFQWWRCKHMNVRWFFRFILNNFINIIKIKRNIFVFDQIFCSRFITKYHVLFHFFVHLIMFNRFILSTKTHIWIFSRYILFANVVFNIQNLEFSNQFLSLKFFDFEFRNNLFHKIRFHSKYRLRTKHTWHLIDDNFLNNKIKNIV